jgi:hypothetical protein
MDKSISPVVAMITPGILSLLMENRGLSLEDASDILYNSELYRMLENEGTKVWRLSYPLLYDLLEEELTTGQISFPEEQM